MTNSDPRFSAATEHALFECREFEENAFRSMEVQICGETSTVQFTTSDHGGDHPTSPSVAIDWEMAIELADWIISCTGAGPQTLQVTDEMLERAESAFHEQQEGPLNVTSGMRAAITAALSLVPAPAQASWQPVETRPEIDSQPGRQFILLEGSRRHSDANWYRQHAGEAYIRKPGQPDEMLQYRMDDILRICSDGDIDPHTARVTHWMPGAYPFFPSPVSSADRT